MLSITIIFPALATLAAATTKWPQKWFNEPPAQNDWKQQFAIHCQPDHIDHADTALAYQMLWDWCDDFNEVPAMGIRKLRSTDVHAFVCSWGGKQGCSSLELHYFDVWSGNTSVCIEDGRGWVGQHPYWKKAWGVLPREIDPMSIPNLCRGDGYIVDLDVADKGPHEKPEAQQIKKDEEDEDENDEEEQEMRVSRLVSLGQTFKP